MMFGSFCMIIMIDAITVACAALGWVQQVEEVQNMVERQLMSYTSYADLYLSTILFFFIASMRIMRYYHLMG